MQLHGYLLIQIIKKLQVRMRKISNYDLWKSQYRSFIKPFDSHKINLLMNTPNTHIFKIEILAKDKQLLFYEWHVAKSFRKKL